MSFWLQRGSVFLFAGAVYFLGLYLSKELVERFTPGLCSFLEVQDRAFCDWIYFTEVGLPMVVLGQYLAAVALILLFANARGFRIWVRMSAVFVPVAVFIIFALFPAPFILGDIPRDIIARDAGILYAVITLCIVLYTRRKSQ